MRFDSLFCALAMIVLTAGTAGAVTLTETQVITENTVLTGETYVRGDGFSGPMFQVQGGTLTLTDVTVDSGGATGASNAFLNVEEGGACVLGDGAVLKNAAVPSQAGGGINNFGRLTVDGAVISGDCNAVILNAGDLVVEDGRILPDPPAPNDYNYAIMDLDGHTELRGGQIGPEGYGDLVLSHGGRNGLTLAPGVEINGTVTLDKDAPLVVTGPLPAEARYTLAPKLLSDTAGAVLVQPAQGVTLSLDNFVCGDETFRFGFDNDGNLVLRDLGPAEFEVVWKPFIFIGYGWVFPTGSVMIANSGDPLEDACLLIAYYDGDGVLRSMEQQVFRLKNGTNSYDLTTDGVPYEGLEGGEARIFVLQSTRSLAPLGPNYVERLEAP